MARTNTFHFRKVDKSEKLRLLVRILMAADKPLTVMEIQLEAQNRRTWIANPATEVGEIAMNDGYVTSDGPRFGQKAGPAVHFPDGKYRYWIERAPGWTQRWHVADDFAVVSGVPGSYAVPRIPEQRRSSVENEPVKTLMPSVCRLVSCKKPLPDGHDMPFCDHDCRTEWFKIIGTACRREEK